VSGDFILPMVGYTGRTIMPGNVLIKTDKGWIAYDENKRRLGGPYPTKKDASSVTGSEPVPEGGNYGGRNTKEPGTT